MRHAGRLSVALVALVLGILVVGQLRTRAAGTGLETLSIQELTLLVGNLNDRNDQLRNEVAALRAQADALAARSGRGESSVDQLRLDLARTRAWSGLDPMRGPGARITISGALDPGAVEDLVDELRTAGAEGIAIEGVRLVPGTSVSGVGGALAIDGYRLEDPFSIDAIGETAVLTGSLTRAGGIVARLAATFPSVRITVTPVEQLLVPASLRRLEPTSARPRG